MKIFNKIIKLPILDKYVGKLKKYLNKDYKETLKTAGYIFNKNKAKTTINKTNNIIAFKKPNNVTTMNKENTQTIIEKPNKVVEVEKLNNVITINKTNTQTAINKPNKVVAIEKTNKVISIDKAKEARTLEKTILSDIDKIENMTISNKNSKENTKENNKIVSFQVKTVEEIEKEKQAGIDYIIKKEEAISDVLDKIETLYHSNKQSNSYMSYEEMSQLLRKINNINKKANEEIREYYNKNLKVVGNPYTNESNYSYSYSKGLDYVYPTTSLYSNNIKNENQSDNSKIVSFDEYKKKN